MESSELKVLHGMSEIANQGIGTVEALRNNDITADMVVWRKNYLASEPDIDLKIGNYKVLYPIYAIKMLGFAIKAWQKYNVLHSHFGHTLLPYAFDLKIDKIQKMKVFSEFHGSELRWAYKDLEYEYIDNYTRDVSKTKRQKKLNKIIHQSDGIILHDVELLQHLPDTKTPVYIVPLRLNLDPIVPCFPDSDKTKPIIVHAPSKRSGKGTEQILQILKEIDLEYELILVEGRKHSEAFEIYKKADIIIDQISVGTYGVFAIEAMALGKPVITYISESMKKSLPRELPIVSAGFNDLKDVLEELIEDGNKRQKVGIQGRAYVEKYHDSNKIAKLLIDLYTGQITQSNLFYILGGKND